MHHYGLKDVLKGRYIFEGFDKEMIQNLINSLHLNNLVIFLSSRSF